MSSLFQDYPEYAYLPPPMNPEPTLRDYFAMSALTGLITEAVKAKEPTLYPDLAKRAFQLADYMLIERDKT